ncbi:MAG TPA: hypothetical protein VM620_09730 [Hyphomicrobium sp.]|nr:hypothetical protein [Hyphomicrobium sp.]
MSVRKSRHQAMLALLVGSATYGARREIAQIALELSELGRCSRLQPLNRQRLLQVIHASRAIDTCLSTILAANGINPKSGIGGKLYQLNGIPRGRRGHLPTQQAKNFEVAIAHKRNRYTHSAGAFPTSAHEVDTFVSDVQACLTMVL